MTMEPIRYDCPTCGRYAGERCVEPDGDLRDAFHFARVDLARGGPDRRMTSSNKRPAKLTYFS